MQEVVEAQSEIDVVDSTGGVTGVHRCAQVASLGRLSHDKRTRQINRKQFRGFRGFVGSSSIHKNRNEGIKL
jgi:hypothetical protein